MPRFRATQRRDGSNNVRRLYIVGAFFAVCFGILASRALVFHLKDNGQLERVALRQYRTAVMESSQRGKIVDTVDRDLAIDVTADSIFANPREIENPVDAATRLAGMLDIDRTKLLDRLSADRKFVWVKRWASQKEAEAIKAMEMKGIYAMKESRRSYPNGMTGATLLGAVGLDGEPLGGLELYYDDILSTREMSDDLKRDARGHLYLSPTGGDTSAERRNIRLTIDKTLQYVADTELDAGVRSASARGGEAVVVDVKTGKILAISNVPTFDPNEYSKYPLASWKNGAIVDPQEPGSTFKVIPISVALDRGVVKPGDKFDCEGGKITIGKDVIRDAHPHGVLSVADIIKVSSNIGAYKVNQKLGRKQVLEAIDDFGFGKETGIDLPGEAPGIITDLKRWSPVQDATVAFGQGIAVTPLQMAMAFAAIANNGKLMKPYIVEKVVAENGTVISETEPTVASTPIGPQAAAEMTKMLTAVVEGNGTGALAASVDYRVAGKTGTAQKVDSRTGAYARGKFYSSFVGFAPVESPVIAVFVGIDEPRGQHYGGQVAAPVFRKIVEKTLRYMKVPASKHGDASAITADAAQTPVPEDDVPVVQSGDDGSQQVVKTDNASWVLPDFRGMTMRGVLAAAGDASIEWAFHGSGIAVKQWPEPGSVLKEGDVCKVDFIPLM